MSLSTPPLRGFPDYQRLVNRDSGVIYDYSTVIGNATIDLGLQDCSRYGYLGGQITDAVASHLIQFTWYADAAATRIVGIREFVIGKNIGSGAFPRLVNLGPFVRVKLFPLGVANYKAIGVLFFTDRYHPLELIPTSHILINQVNTPVGAGGIVQTYPNDYYAGPVLITAFTTIGGMQVITEAISGAGAVETIDVTLTAAATWQRWVSVTPPGLWNIAVSNAGAAGNFFLNVTPSMTGSI